MIKLFKHLKSFIWLIMITIILIYIQTMIDLSLPDYMSRIVNRGIINKDMNYIWDIGYQMVLIALGGALVTIAISFLASRISTAFARDIRTKVFAKVESFSLVEFNKFGTASLITRTTNDITQLRMFIFMLLRVLISAPIMAIGGYLKAINKSPSLSWIIGVSVGILVIAIVTLLTIGIPKIKILQQSIDKLNLIIREHLTGIRVIKAFNNEQYQEEKFDVANIKYRKINLFLNRLMVVLNPMMMLVMNITVIGIVWFGAKKVDIGVLQIGDMLAFMQYVMQIMISFLMLSMMFIILPRASVSANRLNEVITMNPIIKDPATSGEIDKTKQGYVEFNNVTFSYPNAESPVLNDINFIAKPNQVTAFIGGTGSGKSTIINLIPRFYDVTSGQILVDGVDVRNIKQHELRAKIGYVPQKGVLFSGTIADNLRYGKEDATNEEMEEATKIAQIYDFINNKEDKLEALIAEGGTNVSGGQKQRLSIARAIIKKPSIYIFDDSFSALDFKTDKILRKALKKQIKDATVLIVTQRISTIMDADQIVVLDKGKIVGIGNHKYLMNTCDVYKEMALSQLSKEELV
ncbi:MAG: ABC transporter ATP-binding protein [Bacilli bacterium]|jgi:ATP-binding cassette subfamily B multidrug efflux pump